MDVQKIYEFANMAEENSSAVWEDVKGRYEIVFTSHFISLLESEPHETLLDSWHCKILLLQEPDCIASIGGFQAHNEGKRLADERNMPLVTIPTQLANDSFGTNRYSLMDNEQSASIESVFPVKTVFDIPFIEDNGMEKSLWGIGEFIGLYFSIVDYSMKSNRDFGCLLSWIVDQIQELDVLGHEKNDRQMLKKIAILLTIKCLVMRANGQHEIGCGIDHSFARCFEEDTAIPHGKAVYMGSLLANVLFPEWEQYGLSMPLLLTMGEILGITKTDIHYLQSLNLQTLIRKAVLVRPNRSISLVSIQDEHGRRISAASKRIKELEWEN